jgi:hypothetical protein
VRTQFCGWSHGTSVNIVYRLRAGRLGSFPVRGFQIFLLATLSRSDLSSIQSPNIWVLEALASGVNWLDRKSSPSHSSSSGVR